MKILFVSDVSIHHVIGGAERVLYEQATGMANRGHDVHVLTRRLPEHKTNEAVIQGVHEWRYHVDESSNLLFFLSTLGNGHKLFERIQKRYAFDCIHGHQPFSAWAVRRSPSCEGIPFIYTCHSLWFEEFITRREKPKGIPGQMLYGVNVAMRKWIERRVFRASRHVIVLSEFTRDKLVSIYHIPEEKISIIPGGVDINRFKPLADRKETRKRFGLPEDGIILFTVRNLVPRMGLENLIEAMEDIVKAVPGTLLIIGGNGPLRESLLKLTQKRGMENAIRFTGFIPEQDLPSYFGLADLFVLPTITLEGFGLVTVEALACGTPALGTPVGGTLEILGGLGTDYIFKDTSAKSISTLIIQKCREWAANIEAHAILSQRCRHYVETNYSWNRNIDLTEALYAEYGHE